MKKVYRFSLQAGGDPVLTLDEAFKTVLTLYVYKTEPGFAQSRFIPNGDEIREALQVIYETDPDKVETRTERCLWN